MSSWKQLFQKGVAMFRAGQLDDALALFTEVGHHGRLIYAGAYSAYQALSLEANEYTLYDSRAAVNEKLGKTKDALRDCKRGHRSGTAAVASTWLFMCSRSSYRHLVRDMLAPHAYS